jgi:hypothetical protein
MSVEQYLRQMHSKELERMTRETSHQLQEFISFYHEKMRVFKESVEIIE